MPTFKIIAGDFGLETTGHILVGNLYRKSVQGFHMPVPHHGFASRIGLGQIETLEIATEENLKKIGGIIGWGIAGGLALGSIGALAGVLAGGRKKEIAFVCRFKDGRGFLGSCNAKTYSNLQAARFAAPAADKQEIPKNVKVAVALFIVAVLLVAVSVFLHPGKSDKA